MQKQQGAWRGPVHLVVWPANTITTEPEKHIKTSVLDEQVTPLQAKGTVIHHVEKAI